MQKKSPQYICSSCGSGFSKWHGKCPDCGEWNSVFESHADTNKTAAKKAEIFTLSEISAEGTARIDTGLSEFNLVCGGGLVPGSVILIGGEPGIGKSTLALQIAGKLKTLYISGEESPAQIKQRADRLSIKNSSLNLSTACNVEQIIEAAHTLKPQCLIIDSVQTIYTKDIPGMAGSVSQIREASSRLADFSKKNGIPVLLIGHITKEGSIAGPKVLEHLVDTVLYFEGDSSRDFRILRSFKNRYGSVNELGLFRMTSLGLEEVKDKNKIFLNPFMSSSPGNAVTCALEGSRTILYEVQSLVTETNFSNPRRMSDGLDLNRLIIMCAVLEKHTGIQINNFDVFLNVSGGFRISETAADLAVAMSIASSVKNKSIPEKTGLLGEISLAGELRPVSQCGRRASEFRLAGFETLIIPAGDAADVKNSGYKGELIPVKTIHDAASMLFKY